MCEQSLKQTTHTGSIRLKPQLQVRSGMHLHFHTNICEYIFLRVFLQATKHSVRLKETKKANSRAPS